MTAISPDSSETAQEARQQQTLITERLILRPFTAADWPAFDAIEADSDMQRWQRVPMSDTKFRQHYFAYLSASKEQGGPLFARAICLRTTGTLIGLGIAYASTGTDPQGIHIGFGIARRYWGQGFATEAARAQIDHLFTSHGVERLGAGCFAGNVASARVLQKLGMRRLSLPLRVRWKERFRRADRDRVIQWYTLTVDEWLSKCPARDAVQ